MSGIKGYKVFNSDWTCRGFQYKVGETFECDGDIALCDKGFHFCQKASDCFNYYKFDPKNKVAEVLAVGLCKTENDKTVTNKILIVREIEWGELLKIVNTGQYNTGSDNTGNYNTGNRNTGNRNTGNRNAGDCNAGDCNARDCNTGNRNTGNYNTGDYNTGNYNTGDYNTGDYNTGFFSSVTPKITLFEKETDLTPCQVRDLRGIRVLNQKFKNNWWVYEENMSEEEKEQYPSYKTTGGYLKTIPFEDACKLMWNNLTEEEKAEVKNIPNFDKRIFKEITGIEV